MRRRMGGRIMLIILGVSFDPALSQLWTGFGLCAWELTEAEYMLPNDEREQDRLGVWYFALNKKWERLMGD